MSFTRAIFSGVEHAGVIFTRMETEFTWCFIYLVIFTEEKYTDRRCNVWRNIAEELRVTINISMIQ